MLGVLAGRGLLRLPRTCFLRAQIRLSSSQDFPGAVGAIAVLRQGVAVVSAVTEAGPVASTVTDFTVSGLGDDDPLEEAARLTTNAALGTAVTRRRCVATLPFVLSQGSLAAVHILGDKAHGTAYHLLPPRRKRQGPPVRDVQKHLRAAVQEIKCGTWPVSAVTGEDGGAETDMPEVPEWRVCLLCKVLTSAEVGVAQHVTLLDVWRVVSPAVEQ
eukprot:Hpha_TRINITY_DN23911_c0_g1::TRINITY_DN23911_c0_g1_i1::g.137720::m.137720